MIKNFDELMQKVKLAPRGTAVIAAAQTESALDAAILAKREGVAESLLVGDKSGILQLLEKMLLI
jgi:phosphate butyryltransferase